MANEHHASIDRARERRAPQLEARSRPRAPGQCREHVVVRAFDQMLIGAAVVLRAFEIHCITFARQREVAGAMPNSSPTPVARTRSKARRSVCLGVRLSRRARGAPS